MKPVLYLLLLALSAVPADARIRLYSRALAEKNVTDSLRTIDSLRIADSVHVADSMMIDRYKVADRVLKEEFLQLQKQKEREAAAAARVAPSERIIPEDVDDISARTIVIADDSPYARTIDSLQLCIDSICNSIHDNDKWYKTMKMFPVSEKRRYLNYLMHNNYKDTAEVLVCCNKLTSMYTVKLELLIAIRDSQRTNKRIFMKAHIDEQRRRNAELSEYIVALSPVVPYRLQHGKAGN